MNILLVDDCNEVFPYINAIIKETHNDWHLDFAISYETALSMLQTKIYDLFILDYELDINNPSKNGLNLGFEIKERKEYKYTPIIFETSFPEYIYEAINKLNCIYYLLKPYTKQQLLDMIDKISSLPDRKKGILLRDMANIDFYIYFDDIIVIESNKHQLTIVTTTDTIMLNRASFKDFNEFFMFRCHKSYMINMNYAIAYDSNLSEFTIRNPLNNQLYRINVGRAYKKLAEERMKNR